MPLDDCFESLNAAQSGLAIVVEDESDLQDQENYAVGIIAMEDVLECVVKTQIEDEKYKKQASVLIEN